MATVVAGRTVRGGAGWAQAREGEARLFQRSGAVLEVRGAVCRFGDVTAVDDVSLSVPAGDALGLIGPNGAGKSTLLAALGGQVHLQAGAVMLDGDALQTLRPHARAARGVHRTFQIPRPFRRLTVLENLTLAAIVPPGDQPLAGLRRDAVMRDGARRAGEEARELLAPLGLDDVRNAPAGTLSGGQLKLLDLARALLGGPADAPASRLLVFIVPLAIIAALVPFTEGRKTAWRRAFLRLAQRTRTISPMS